MEQIEGKKLDQMVTDASNEMIGEEYRDGLNAIKRLLHAIKDLGKDIRQLEVTIEKKQGQLKGKQSLLEKIKAGDWAALSLKEDNSQNNEHN